MKVRTRLVLVALAAALASAGCGDGTITFGGGDGDDTARVTVTGNLDSVLPVTTRNIVAFAFTVDDDSQRCPCPPDPSAAGSGRGAVLASGQTTFTLTGLNSGAIGVVFLLDEPGNNADGQIDPGDPIAVLDDVDCELDRVRGNVTVTLTDVDITFSETPVADCRIPTNSQPADGRARARQIRQQTTQE